MFKNMIDEMVVVYAKEGNEEAKNELIRRYTPMIHRFINKYHNDSTMSNDLIEDLYSEGVFAILTSINNYNQDKSKFTTHVFYHIRQAVQVGLRQTMKSIRNGEGSFDSEMNDGSDDNTTTLYDIISDNRINIEGDYIEDEKRRLMWSVAKEVCTDKEYQTFCLLATDGLSYEEIAEKLDSTVSAVCRRRQRAMEKIQKKISSLQ